MDFTIDVISKSTRLLGVVGCAVIFYYSAVIFYYNAVDYCVPADSEGGGERIT